MFNIIILLNIAFTLHLIALLTFVGLLVICGSKDSMKNVAEVAYWSWMFVEIVLLIWGSVVVFGAWPTWTLGRDRRSHCPYSPMMFAFVLLILGWVS